MKIQIRSADQVVVVVVVVVEQGVRREEVEVEVVAG